MDSSFVLDKTCLVTRARAGWLATGRGTLPTPLFIPVGSQGCVKTLMPEELGAIGVRMVLGNAYHLYLRPGIETIGSLGGLHRFMGWPGPILTDSGGYQVFSLASLQSVSDEGVSFRSHIDGSEHFFSPEGVVRFQEGLGSDIIMPLDHCPPYGLDRNQILEATNRTHVWAERSLRASREGDQVLYGIVQGGVFPEMRRESCRMISDLGFSGCAIGGLSIGEPKALTLEVLEETVVHLPQNKPRYLMGVGSPEDLVEGVARGVDLFDSALPTRTARNGALFTSTGRRNIHNARYKTMDSAIDGECDCYTCRTFSVAYLHHLFKSKELLAYRLATIHNLRFIVRLMEGLRQSIIEDRFVAFKEAFLGGYQTTNEEVRLAQKKRWLGRFVKGFDEGSGSQDSGIVA